MFDELCGELKPEYPSGQRGRTQDALRNAS
jgi:hypothetical protein